MAGPAESWTTQQLAEFVAVISEFTDEESALRGGVDRAAEAMDAEVAALVEGGEVITSIGFPLGRAPVQELAEASGLDSGSADLPGLGRCEVLTAAAGEDGSSRLLVARLGGDGYSQEESDLRCAAWAACSPSRSGPSTSSSP